MGLTCTEAERLPVTQFYEIRALELDNSNVFCFLKKDVALAGFKLEFFLPQLPNAGMPSCPAPC